MASTQLIVRDSGLAKSHFRGCTTSQENHRNDRFETFSGFRYPRVLNSVRPVDFDEPPVMVPAAPFMQNCLIEKTIHSPVQPQIAKSVAQLPAERYFFQTSPVEHELLLESLSLQ